MGAPGHSRKNISKARRQSLRLNKLGMLDTQLSAIASSRAASRLMLL